MSELKKGQKVFMIIMYILTAISLVVSAFVIYNMATTKKPWTIGVTYADKLSFDENQASIATIKVHGNENNNGQAVYDLQFSSYTDADGNGVTSFGIQCVGDWEIRRISDFIGNIPAHIEFSDLYKKYKGKMVNETYVLGDFSLYYTADGGTTYTILPEDKVDDFLLIDIGGEFYRLSLKTYTYTTEKTVFLWWKTTETRTAQYTWYEVFDYLMTSAINNSGKEEFSQFPLPLMDCAEYLTIEKYDGRQYHPLDKTTEVRNYLTVPVDYTKNGATVASDSLFKMVNASTAWEFYSHSDLDEYWNAYSEIEITAKNINFVYNSLESAYYITIDKTFAEYLNNLTNAEISISINLDEIDLAIYGIDLQNFTFDIEAFNVSATNHEALTVYNQSACDIVPTFNLGGV